MIVSAQIRFAQGDDTTYYTDAIRADKEFILEGLRWHATSIRATRDGSLIINARCLGRA